MEIDLYLRLSKHSSCISKDIICLNFSKFVYMPSNSKGAFQGGNFTTKANLYFCLIFIFNFSLFRNCKITETMRSAIIIEIYTSRRKNSGLQRTPVPQASTKINTPLALNLLATAIDCVLDYWLAHTGDCSTFKLLQA